MNPALLLDSYKLGHRVQYPPGTEYVYSTWIPRRSLVPGIEQVVAFGFQRFIKKYLIDAWTRDFFSRGWDELEADYNRGAEAYGVAGETAHLKALHDLGYLPLRIRAVPEGTIVPLRVPMLTIENTHPDFFWLTNYLETLFSAEVWQASTSATIANEYRRIFERYARETNPEALDFVPFQGHDFSMRGMSSVESACSSGLGHLLSFVGTDSVPATIEAQTYYPGPNGLVGTSIPATEHSVMCAGGPGDGELETYRRLIEDVYPSGFVSIVSDTWDLWHVVTQTLGVDLRDGIMARDGRVVVRPDSGDPVNIMCGTLQAAERAYIAGRLPDYAFEPTEKGVIELLWDAFGGAISSTGYKVLDPHIGAIYGDSITLDRAEAICARLKAKGFASTNAVLGIGSFTYQHNTRDTFGFAMKATWVQINGEQRSIFKDPITDDGTKKSLTGRVAVLRDHGRLYVIDGLDKGSVEEDVSLLSDVFVDGTLVRASSLADVRTWLADQQSEDFRIRHGMADPLYSA